MTSTTQQYARSILGRSREPMEPVDYVVDWDDAPLRNAVYRGVRRIPLPAGPGAAAPWRDLDRCLRASYAPFTRRTRITPNTGAEHMQTVQGAIYGRGSASGGGMYPVELYLVVGSGTGVPAGVYHYSSGHHMLDVLLVGDVRERVRTALGEEAGADGLPPVYVLAAVNFWKNAFKYNSFCYHVVTSDIGTLFGAWREVGPAPDVRLWFDEDDLDDLLGLDPDLESVFAVVPWGADADAPGRPAAPELDAGRAASTVPARVQATSVQRSRRTEVFAWNRAVQQDMLADDGPGPARTPDLEPLTGLEVAATLPAGRPATRDALPGAVAGRHSAFGLFTSQGGVTQQEIADLLACAGGERLVPLPGQRDVTGLLRLSVFANHVAGLAPGAYHHDPATGDLLQVPGEAVHPFLQYAYYLTNYNLEQAAAVIAVSGRPEAVIGEVGPRGYRLVNAELGAVCQRTYLAAQALGLGCGVVFGFDNVAVRERLGRAGTDEWPLLLMMVGRERTGAAQFRYVLPTAPDPAAAADRLVATGGAR